MATSPDSRDDDESVDSDFQVPSVGVELVPRGCLVVVGGREAGRTYSLVHRESVIGRGSKVEVQIDDGAISTRHAKIVWEGHRHVLIDLGSTNGTFLNGTRLTPDTPAPLAFGDSVQVADIALAYLEPTEGSEKHTQQLALVGPQTGGGRSAGLGVLDATLIAQLLQSAAPPQEREPKAATIEELIEKLMGLVAFVRRNWVPLFAATALFALAGTGSVLLSPPSTQASMKLRITMKAPGDVFQQKIAREEIEQFYNEAEQSFLSPALVESTLQSIDKKRPSRGEVTQALAALKFDSVAFSTYEGTFTHQQPEFAYRFLSTHLKNYLATEVQRTVRGIKAEVDFVTGRLKESEQELRKTEEELKAFKAKHMEGLPDHQAAHFTSREALMLRRAELSAEASRSALALADAKRRLSEEVPLSALQMQNAAPYEQSLVEVRRKIAEAKARGLGPQHPEILALTKQQSEMETLANQARSGKASELDLKANPGLMDLRNRVRDLEVQTKGSGSALGEINAQLARLDAIWKDMPEVEAQYAQLTRVYTSSRELHSKLFERLRTSQVQLELERSSAAARYEVVSPPEASGVPLRSAVFKRAGIGIALGLLVGIALSLVLELRRYLQRSKAGRSVGMPRLARAARTDALRQDITRI